MDRHDAALVLAGVIGCSVAVFHGVLVQRLMVRPVERLAATRLAPPIRRLVAALLHFSTYNWFLGGLVLLLAAFAWGPEARAMAMRVAQSASATRLSFWYASPRLL